jgi:hypothetical protein
MTRFIIVVALLAVAALVVRRLLGRKRQAAAPAPSAVATMKRPRFKDFRHSGSTYEESHANYVAAVEKYQRLTGRTYSDEEE